MEPPPYNLFTWRGRIDRLRYALIGSVLILIKYNIDRWIAAAHQRPWSPLRYWMPSESGAITSLTPDERRYYLTLVLTALPFIWVGICLTVRRLRDARLPLWLVVLFFVPFVNVLFFLVLSQFPTRSAGTPTEGEEDDGSAAKPGVLTGLFPEHPLGSAILAILLTLLLCGAVTAFGAEVLENYGWGLFVGVPFCLGLIGAALHGVRGPRTLSQCLGVATWAWLLGSAGLLAFAFEGLICLIMAAPITGPLALLGGLVGFHLQNRPAAPGAGPPPPPTRVYGTLLFALPLFMGLERLWMPEPTRWAVRTSVVIEAPPERVWPNVVTFSELPAPDDWIFRTGIAYPLRARIDGRGVGAVRHCVFSTGAFVEPITVWDAPRRLRFDVTAQPPPMRELSPYGVIHPPHLDDFLRSREGQFLLTPLPGGRTRLEGTTWYEHRIWPERYWRLWSDAIIHRIHDRVLRHIEALSEQQT